ncbi:MAG: SsrA-binding protein SmpB [Clostridiales Family XIII bacterium]|nr:SsrA-binding protein SmpB [Clostridiales Family XIII bacterium]
MYKIITKNKKARFEYFFLEKFEAGIVLFGTEIKSIRMGKVSISESYARIDKYDEVWINNMHISPYENGNIFNKDPIRPKKLLLHKREVNKIRLKLNDKGLTLIPTMLYIENNGKAKIELAIGKGKKLHDKRATIKKRDDDRKMKKGLGKMSL